MLSSAAVARVVQVICMVRIIRTKDGGACLSPWVRQRAQSARAFLDSGFPLPVADDGSVKVLP